jgi:predicted O-methyltransferase YrrM
MSGSRWRPSDPAIAAELERLQQAAAENAAARRERGGFRPEEDTDDLVRLGSEYLSLSPNECRLLYLLARGTGARRVVEFGASYGVSTLTLAAAVRASAGYLWTTEVHPEKCAALRESLARAGVEDCVTLLEGDARETLTKVAGPLDLVLLDGWKGMYLPVLKLLRPMLRPGALVVADNLGHAGAADYLAHVSDPESGFITHVEGGFGLSLLE